MNTQPTRADRIHALIARIAPAAAEQHATDGTWPNGECPYVITTLEDGGRRLVIRGVDPDGEPNIRAASGPTLEAAIAALEAKL